MSHPELSGASLQPRISSRQHFTKNQRFPYLVFYVENATQIEIRRVLHTRRDLLAELAVDNEDD